ncbi:MAG: alpha/beta hydrolase [Planktotalea sp.]|uniref:alpha/beta hydrolase n=1 Tax=Planktotalea sp. TaxID=2029877 RepID=UPI003C757F2A
MNPDTNSPELQSANRLLRRTLKPMLRYIPSQPFINWMTHRRKPVSGPKYDGAGCEWTMLGRIDALRAVPGTLSLPDACMLYFHGGAYTVGSPASSEPDARRLAISCGMTVFSAKYRKATQAPYPAAVDDAEAAYKAILQLGFEPSQIVLAGTSAGGGLALALLHRLLEQGDPLPSCVITLSAWLDLTLSHPSIDLLARQDVLLSRAWIARAARMYGGNTPLQHPEVSPAFGNFKGSPPNLLLYSKVELFRDEIEAFAAKLTQAGVAVESAPHNNAPHAWPMVEEQTPETQSAFELIADFAQRHLTKPKK